MEAVAVALITAVPTTLTAFGAYVQARRAASALGSQNGAGSVHDQLQRMKEQLDDLAVWQKWHVSRFHDSGKG